MSWLDRLCIWEVRVVGMLLVLWFIGWLALNVIEKLSLAFKAKRMLFEYIWHRKEFREWLNRNCTHVPPAAPCSDTTSSVVAARNNENEKGTL